MNVKEMLDLQPSLSHIRSIPYPAHYPRDVDRFSLPKGDGVQCWRK